MTWVNFYLLCFAAGFAFSVLSFFTGGLRWHLPFHIHLHSGVVHTSAGHGSGAGHARGGARGSHGKAAISPVNPVTMAAFLTWFGATGYLLTRHSTAVSLLIVASAVAVGLAGAGIVFVFLARVLTSPQEELDPADYDMVGVLGRISVPVRERGTGEIIYSQAGTRRACGARADQGCAIAKGTEVVVTRYEKGIAYVRLWSELAGEDATENRSTLASPENNGGPQ
jgi:membrane protein implicated in regulation of membrane protease activity